MADVNHIITAQYNTEGYFVTDKRFMWDKGQILQFIGFDLPETFEVHIRIPNDRAHAYPRYGTTVDGVKQLELDNELFTFYKDIRLWLYLSDTETDAETRFTIDIPVEYRAKPIDYEPTPSEKSIISKAIDLYGQAVDKTAVALEAAESARDEAIEAKDEAIEAKNRSIAATDSDIGMAHSPKTVVNGQVSEWQYIDVEKFGDEITFLQDELYSYDEATPSRNQNNVRILDTGYYSVYNGYRTYYYAVTPGQFVKVVSNEKCQFQNSDGYSTSGSSVRIGKTYNAGKRCLIVPENATYLAVCTEKSKGDPVVSFISKKSIGVSDYEDLENKPQINSVELIGNKGYDDFGLANANVIAPNYEDLTIPIAESTPCIHDGQLYISNLNIVTSEPWTPAHWDRLEVADGLLGAYQQINTKYEKPSTGIPASDLAPGAVPVQDVQVNGTSVLSGGVANVPIASANALGVAKVANNGIWVVNGELRSNPASEAQIKTASSVYNVITPNNQKSSAFYGLAAASGDTTQKSSSNAVGAYTDSAKSAIHEMLNGSVSVTGTTPSITALPGVRYVCGEVSTLDITLPASGIVDVTFESGSTATVLTITPPTGVTLKWANGFDPTSLDANTTYEINIADGLGVAAAWT